MASQGGSENLAVTRRGVEDRLFAEPYCFEFFQAVRLMQIFFPNGQRVGYFQSPQSETVRFGVRPSLSFPPSELYSLNEKEEWAKKTAVPAPPMMRVNFMGLIGPSGQLPLYYTELVAERAQARDRTLRDFLDIFHHRAISLFYRAWEKYRFAVPFERGEEDKFSHYLLSIIGLGLPSLQHRQMISKRGSQAELGSSRAVMAEPPRVALPAFTDDSEHIRDYEYLYYGGLLAQQPRSAEGLELMLQEYFGVPVKVDQFLGAWYRLDTDSQCNLDDDETDSQQLGFGTVVGDEIWDPQSHARIVIGPLTLKQYADFLPTGTGFKPLRMMVRFYAGDELDFEVQLILRKEEAPPCLLGGEDGLAPQLGWLSWATTAPMKADPDQTVMQL
jgi:type VI secretion system protein ImpH